MIYEQTGWRAQRLGELHERDWRRTVKASGYLLPFTNIVPW